MLLGGGGLVVTDTTSIGRTPPRHSKKQQFKRRDSRRHMSYLRKGRGWGGERAEHYSNNTPTDELSGKKNLHKMEDLVACVTSQKQSCTIVSLSCDVAHSKSTHEHLFDPYDTAETRLPCMVVDGAGQGVPRATGQNTHWYLYCLFPVGTLHQAINHLTPRTHH